MAGSDESGEAGVPGPVPFYLRPDVQPLSSRVQVTYGARSRRGRDHATNSDHYLILEWGRQQLTLQTSLPDGLIPPRFDEFGYAMVVADGMGAFGDGEIASRIAISTLAHLMLQFGKWNLRIDDRVAQEIMGRARRFYSYVDSEVVQHGLKSKSKSQTTLTATFGAGRDLFFAHVGHSRAYLRRAGRLMRLTRDHTVGAGGRPSTLAVAPLLDVDAAARDLQHVLTDAIGMSGGVGPKIDIERIRLEDDDRVLVCTNGLTDAVDEALLGEILGSDRSPDEQSEMLVDLAVVSGGEDDVTALVARYRIPE